MPLKAEFERITTRSTREEERTIILYFSSGPEYLNIFFDNGSYSRDFHPGAHYIEISTADYINLLAKVQRNNFTFTAKNGAGG